VVLPKEDKTKDVSKARHVGLKSGADDFEGGNIVEPPEPPRKKGLLERMRKLPEENRDPPRY
jgi:hypothetical protein